MKVRFGWFWLRYSFGIVHRYNRMHLSHCFINVLPFLISAKQNDVQSSFGSAQQTHLTNFNIFCRRYFVPDKYHNLGSTHAFASFMPSCCLAWSANKFVYVFVANASHRIASRLSCSIPSKWLGWMPLNCKTCFQATTIYITTHITTVLNIVDPFWWNVFCVGSSTN